MINTDEFLLQPSIYSTHGNNSLLELLENHWIKNVELGEGTFYIVSGFGNYNGGVRFYDHFKNHISYGGQVKTIIGGGASQRLSSRQLAKGLLETGASVNVVNRKHILHAKCYGYKTNSGQSLVVSSGNFTGPGVSQNVEAALSLSDKSVSSMGFDWDDFFNACLETSDHTYSPTLPVDESVEWKLLYNEERGRTETVKETEKVTMLVLLGRADTARINADPGTSAGKGSQYFWLSKEALDFFPALTIPNARGTKPTYSTIVNINFIDIGVERESRVTFEAGNNLDFRLGTGPLRYSKLASEFDIAAISRRKNASYELRIFQKSHELYPALSKYLIYYVGHQGKKFGYLSNEVFDQIIKQSQ